LLYFYGFSGAHKNFKNNFLTDWNISPPPSCGQRISQARNQHEAGSKQLCILLSPEDGGDMFLQDIS
jgi:hypothetical protein